MSLPAMTFGDRFCFSRKGEIGGGGWCTQRVHTVWLSLSSALETPWLALGEPLLSSYMHKQVEKTVLSPCTAPISSREAFIPVWASSCQLSALTIANLLMGGCSLSHKWSTCVKFWAKNLTELHGDMVSLIHV